MSEFIVYLPTASDHIVMFYLVSSLCILLILVNTSPLNIIKKILASIYVMNQRVLIELYLNVGMEKKEIFSFQATFHSKKSQQNTTLSIVHGDFQSGIMISKN